MKYIIALYICLMMSVSGSAQASMREELWLQGDHGRLAATIQKPVLKKGAKCPLVIIMHGFTGSKDNYMHSLIADSLLAHGVASIRFDFNGHGRSDGKFSDMTVTNELVDAKNVVSYALSLAWVSRVMLTGHSQGGVVAGMVAGELGCKKIAKVVLLAPASSLRDDAIRGDMLGSPFDADHLPDSVKVGNYYVGREYLRTVCTLPIFKVSARYKGSALLLHGTGDHTVPYTCSEHYHELWKQSRLLLLDGYDHNFSKNLQLAIKHVVDFLVKDR